MESALANSLPKVRGVYRFAVPLAPTNWLRVGGPAEVLFKPADAEDLADFMRANILPTTVLGVGSNVLIRDGGIAGVVIKLGSGFTKLKIEENIIYAGAGLLGSQVAKAAAAAGLAGLEFLVGIPGTIGGALAMNAGAYGQEVKDRLLYAEAVSPEGALVQLPVAEIGYHYRGNSLPSGLVFVGAAFTLQSDEETLITARMEKIMTERAATQPIRSRTAGSTFRNPPRVKVWELIDKVGLRGRMFGGAQFSAMHSNFLLNADNATAQELEDLAELARAKVKAEFDIDLQWEVVRLGHNK